MLWSPSPTAIAPVSGLISAESGVTTGSGVDALLFIHTTSAPTPTSTTTTATLTQIANQFVLRAVAAITIPIRSRGG